MATTTFTPGTVIASSWLNDVNTTTYKEWVSVVKYGATGDGVTDDTTAIQNAVNSGAKLIFFPPAAVAYYFADVVVPTNVTLVGFNTARLKLKPFSGSIGGGYHAFFKAVAANNITVNGFILDGNVSAQTVDASNIDRYASLYFEDCSNLTITNCRVAITAYGNANIRVRQGSNVNIRQNILVDKGVFYNAYSGAHYSVSIDDNQTIGCGIAINDDSTTQHLFGWSITNNRIRASNAFDEAGIGARASNGIISNNTIFGGYFGMTISAGGATFQQHDILVTGNTIAADSGVFNPYGIEHYAYDIIISNNILTNCGIVSSSPTGRNIKIKNNLITATLSSVSTDTAIALSSGLFTGVDISDNLIKGFGRGIVLSLVWQDLILTNNIIDLIDYPGLSEGVRIENATASSRVLTGSTVRGNIVRNASRAWLYALGNGANTLTLTDFKAVFNVTTGTSAGINIAATASLSADSMHSFNELVYPTFQNTPTSSAGLPTGAVWRDAADSNRLKMVP